MNNQISKTGLADEGFDSTFGQSPTLRSPDLNDMKTPPLQTGTVFNGVNDDNKNNNNSFDKIHNLPTPIVMNKSSNKSAFSFSSPILSQNHTFSNSPENMTPNNISNLKNLSSSTSTLRIPKARQKNEKRKPVLVDSNTAFRAEANDSPKRFISDFKIKDRDVSNSDANIRTKTLNSSGGFPIAAINSNLPNSMSLGHIKPVDRVVSLPVQQNSFNNNTQSDKIVIPKTETIPEAREKEHESFHPLHLLTYSIDGNYRPQRWNVSYEIGSGSFSKVYLASDGKTALKVIDVLFNENKYQSEELHLRIQNSLTRELEILKTLKHPNIIKLVGTEYKENVTPCNRITLAIEYCKGGDLYSFVLERRREMSPELIRCLFSNIVSAISFMHDRDICHRDIKLENILLKYSQMELLTEGVTYSKHKLPILVLSDFGLSKKIDPENPLLFTRCGSEDYVSPELLLGMPYDGKQNDCWSTGVVLYTILESRLPFDPLPSEKDKPLRRQSKPAHRIAMLLWSWYLLKDENEDAKFKQAKEIVKSLLTKRNKRATMNDIKNNPWCKPYILES